jgi:REP element-mobilizing transposase RayT
MPQSLVKNYLHIIFSTKERYPFINESIVNELYPYLGGICNNLECQSLQVGGYRDHVHILCVLSRKIALMKLIKELKAHSSGWIKTKGEAYRNFYWQSGYGAFSVQPSYVESTIRYIRDQRKHHRNMSFKEEYLRFLSEYKMEYDERYVWD